MIKAIGGRRLLYRCSGVAKRCHKPSLTSFTSGCSVSQQASYAPRATSEAINAPAAAAIPSDVPEFAPKTSLLLEVADRPGALHDVLRWFWKYDVNITRLESRPARGSTIGPVFDFLVDFDGRRGEPRVDALLESLRQPNQTSVLSILVTDDKVVPWFPRHISDLDLIANRVLDAGIDLQSDHPGFRDETYRHRRNVHAEVARGYRHGDRIPRIDYTDDETATWVQVLEAVEPLHARYACHEYLTIMADMRRRCVGYSAEQRQVPQQEDISVFLQRRTGFRLRPVAGLLSSRDFLNCLAFRTFACTQYIRHHSMPLYTPEPDICHELLGHAPMFADPEFADLSQEFGLASLGASDEEITKLARCYWFSVEFGLCRQEGKPKAYGAGLLSSFGELEYACAERGGDGTIGGDGKGANAGRAEIEGKRPELRDWDPNTAARLEFPITTYQPTYFVASSLASAKQKLRDYCEALAKPFHARYNPLSQSIWVDRAVKPAALPTLSPISAPGGYARYAEEEQEPAERTGS